MGKNPSSPSNGFFSRIYNLLEEPFVYNFVQAVLAPGSTLNKNLKSFFLDSQGLVLDVGCGPRLTTLAPAGKILGIDINWKYVRQYLQSGNNGPRIGIVGSAQKMPFKDNTFQESRCFGLLHHLPDEKAKDAIREMLRCTKINGHVIILDNVWPLRPLLRPLAWINRRLDRGRWVRHEGQLSNLVKEVYPGNWQQKRFTYTWTGLEAVGFVLKKNI